MLPKLQQSSIAQSLRKDNPANHNYCNSFFTQAKTKSKVSSAIPTTKTINPGKTNSHQKTHTLPLATSPRTTSPKKNSSTKLTNLITNPLSLDL